MMRESRLFCFLCCFGFYFANQVNAEQNNESCNNQVAIVLAPTSASWGEALTTVANNPTLLSAVTANRGWGAKTSRIPVHMTLTSYAPKHKSNCTSSDKHGSAIKPTVIQLNQAIASNGAPTYRLNAESWGNPANKSELTIFHVQGKHKTLENIFAILKEGGLYLSLIHI